MTNEPKPTAAGVPASRRQEASEQRRLAILDAGLDVFAAEGFATARLDEVAERAGVAKGTIYLFFKDKEDLFEQIVVGAVSPVLAQVDALASVGELSFDATLSALFELFREQVLGTKRREVIRLVLTEGRRFPRIAEFYHREVIAKGLALIRQIAKRARKRGELSSDAVERFPHLVLAPALLSVIWDGLFSTSEALDVKGLMAAHREVLCGLSHRPGQRT